MSNNKKYYKKNYYKNNKSNKEKKAIEKKVTYDDLMHADTITTVEKNEENYNKILIIKYIAITVVLFAIIFGSILLFRQM